MEKYKKQTWSQPLETNEKTTLIMNPQTSQIINGKGSIIEVWDHDGKKRSSLSTNFQTIRGLAALGKLIAASTDTNKILIFDQVTGKRIRTYADFRVLKKSISFDDDGTLIVLDNFGDNLGTLLVKFDPRFSKNDSGVLFPYSICTVASNEENIAFIGRNQKHKKIIYIQGKSTDYSKKATPHEEHLLPSIMFGHDKSLYYAGNGLSRLTSTAGLQQLSQIPHERIISFSIDSKSSTIACIAIPQGGTLAKLYSTSTQSTGSTIIDTFIKPVSLEKKPQPKLLIDNQKIFMLDDTMNCYIPKAY